MNQNSQDSAEVEGIPEGLDDGVDDIDMSPGGNAGNNPDVMAANERSFFTHDPFESIRFPNGKVLHIYPKSKGQLNLITIARQAHYDMLKLSSDKLSRGWRFWRWRKDRLATHLSNVVQAEFGYFQALFDDHYIKERHQNLTEEDFLCIDVPTQTAIEEAYAKANDAEYWVRKIYGDKTIDDGKKKAIHRAISQSGTI